MVQSEFTIQSQSSTLLLQYHVFKSGHNFKKSTTPLIPTRASLHRSLSINYYSPASSPLHINKSLSRPIQYRTKFTQNIAGRSQHSRLSPSLPGLNKTLWRDYPSSFRIQLYGIFVICRFSGTKWDVSRVVTNGIKDLHGHVLVHVFVIP